MDTLEQVTQAHDSAAMGWNSAKILRAEDWTDRQWQAITALTDAGLGLKVAATGYLEHGLIVWPLSGSNFGAESELLDQVNRESVDSDLSALDVETATFDPRVIGPALNYVVALDSEGKALAYLLSVLQALADYPCLDDMRYSDLLAEGGYCYCCGSFGLPSDDEWASGATDSGRWAKCDSENCESLTCEHCDYCPECQG